VYEVRYKAYSVTYFHSEIQDCPYIGAADINGASRQPTSRQNRRSEVADDAGNARKWQATALTAVQVTIKLRRRRCLGCRST